MYQKISEVNSTKAYSKASLVSFLIMLLFCCYFSTVSHLDILPWFKAYNEKRILELLLLLVVAFLSICDTATRNHGLSILSYLPNKSKALLIFILCFGLISSLGANFPKFALLEVSLFTLLFAICLCVASCYVELASHLNKIIAIALILTVWAYLTGFMGYYITALSGDTTFSQRDLFGNFANIRFFSQFQSWTLALIVLPLLVFKNRSFLLTTLFITISIFWWFLLFTSGTRGTLLASFIAIPLLFLIIGKQAKKWFLWQFLAITGGLAAYFLFFFLIPAILSIDIRSVLDNTINRDITRISDRMDLWDAAFKMVQTNPLFGAGPMHYAANENISITHPHSSILQIAAEWGLPVTLSVIILFCWGIYAWIKKVKSNQTTINDKNISAALLASLLTGVIHSLFSGIIVMPLSQVMMILVIGWMLGIWLECNIARVKENCHSQLKSMVLCVVLFAIGFGVVWPIYPELLYVEKLQTQFMDSHPEEKQYHPRFWQQGQLR